MNGTVWQEGDLNQLIWKIPEIISLPSEYFELAAGDVILTGSPAGVGPVERGDTMEATVNGLPALSVKVV
ncbi:fumarylacetoacetate hydrolase family protein [Roseibium album]|uniref:fumarylacetoacetate hydrolase family protein n=1 Tax=Roseibium album TaxID=311410 RepID=UPI003D9A7BA2